MCAGLFLFTGEIMQSQPTIIRRKRNNSNQEIMRKVSEILSTVNHGSITLIIQEGTVFQINKTESRLLDLRDQEQPHTPRKGVH